MSDLYDMLLENSRKYLDVQPSTPAASSAQTKGKENFSSQRQATGKTLRRTLVSIVDLRITG